MAINQFIVDRLSVISSRPFADVVAAIEAAVGHPDMGAFSKDLASANNLQELEKTVHAAIGPSGFMEFMRFDHGRFLEISRGVKGPKILRLVVGNPLIMKQMAEHVSDTASYAPVTILIDERKDGVHLTYDLMASFLRLMVIWPL